jgi:hypothetical protein
VRDAHDQVVIFQNEITCDIAPRLRDPLTGELKPGVRVPHALCKRREDADALCKALCNKHLDGPAFADAEAAERARFDLTLEDALDSSLEWEVEPIRLAQSAVDALAHESPVCFLTYIRDAYDVLPPTNVEYRERDREETILVALDGARFPRPPVRWNVFVMNPLEW